MPAYAGVMLSNASYAVTSALNESPAVVDDGAVMVR